MGKSSRSRSGHEGDPTVLTEAFLSSAVSLGSPKALTRSQLLISSPSNPPFLPQIEKLAEAATVGKAFDMQATLCVRICVRHGDARNAPPKAPGLH